MTEYSDGLSKAVADGVINAGQAELLEDYLKAALLPASSGQPDAEEKVDAIRGFHELFLSIGIICLLLGAYFLHAGIAGILMPLLVWGMAEALHGWRHVRLPMIVLSCALSFSLLPIGSLFFHDDKNIGFGDTPLMLLLSGLWLVSGYAYWRRFRLPFNWLIIATSLVGIAYYGAATLLGEAWVNTHLYWFVLVCGVGVFALAMFFDMQDPARTRTEHEAAFWLHLSAGPMLVHGVMNLNQELVEHEVIVAAISIALVGVLSCLALIVNRRAILVSSLAYFGYSVSTLADKFDMDINISGALALVVVGAFAISMALGWNKTRKLIVRKLPLRVQAMLPPVNGVNYG